MRHALALLALTGCQVLFPLDPPVDAPPSELCTGPDVALCLRFDDDFELDGTADDASPAAHPVSVTDAVPRTRISGDITSPAIGTQNTTRITAGPAGSLDLAGPLTLDFQALIPRATADGLVIDNVNQYSISTTTDGFDNTTLQCAYVSAISGSPPVVVTAFVPGITERWVHIACVVDIDRGRVTLHVDGGEVGVTMASDMVSTNGDSELHIASSGADSRKWIGALDNVRITRRALDGVELARVAAE